VLLRCERNLGQLFWALILFYKFFSVISSDVRVAAGIGQSLRYHHAVEES
jgi:hypothetical protein